MKVTINGFLIITTLLLSVNSFYTQETVPRKIIVKPGETIQWSDKRRNYYEPKIYTSKKDKVEVTQASLTLPILGKISNISSSATKFVVREDVMEMLLFYRRWDNICYHNIDSSIRLKTYSPEKYKYSSNHTLNVYLDDKLLFSRDMDKTAEIPPAQYFSLEIESKDFIEILKAQKVMIQLADTKIDLKEREITALNELSTLVTPVHNKEMSAERIELCSKVME